MKRRMQASGLNPFAPPPGHPPALSGREEEATAIEHALSRLLGERIPGQERLKLQPFPPIRIVGPQGVGKTAMLAWTAKRAQENGIHVVSCAGPKHAGTKADVFQHVLEVMEERGLLFELAQAFGLKASVASDGMANKHGRPHNAYIRVVEEILAKTHLLLLLDDVHNYSLDSQALLMHVNRQLIAERYPLGMIVAGTPGLDSHLREADDEFIVGSKNMYINMLSKDAARGALRGPFEGKGVTVAPEALEAMVAQTDNHPCLIQLVGQAAWQAMEKTGKTEVTAELAAQSSEQARARRRGIYERVYGELGKGGLLEYAGQVVELLESNDGKVIEDAIVKILAKNPDVDDAQAEEIYEKLRETGFIWTVASHAEPGIPSFFSYFKARKEEGGRFT